MKPLIAQVDLKALYFIKDEECSLESGHLFDAWKNFTLDPWLNLDETTMRYMVLGMHDQGLLQMDISESGERYVMITNRGRKFIEKELTKMPKYQVEMLEKSYQRRKARLPTQEYSFKLSTHESF